MTERKERRNMTRKMDSGYFYDIYTNTLIITKEFERKASRINSTEYCILLAYRREHSDLNVAYWKEKHTHKGGMSYDAMEKFIGLYSDSEERLKQFAAMRKCFAKQDRGYFRMKEWFKENYPDYEEQNHQMDEDGFLVAKETANVGA